ncbi:hypothetical protein [Diaphorobacter limosus]|uniref:Transcriptional regulator n=1 Tax=Diaphorobacter limosus TaxID=3036128 RepID=A0ABZ0J6X9_9BURK|nr:hypothetical protein [Diaphorobacter sp. Y-1]MCA0439365.1 hypothetical protein [Pseudomonadota bacterium]WOO32857.1 hypothetical protein P4826_01640 [Diaphorobacter sp. Y-1]
MSAPMHPTMQQLADSVGVSRRLMFQAAAVHRYGCPELVKAAHAGLLAMKHCETLAKALPHDEQREFLAELPSMSPRRRHDLLALLKGDLTHRARNANGGAH